MRALCDEVADAVAEATADVAGTPSGGETVAEGADGTPTSRLDRVAEEAALDVLERRGDLRVVSEEAGEVVFGEPESTVVLDPVDGTYNATHGIPLHATSVAVAEGVAADGDVRDVSYGYVRNLVTGDVYAGRRGEGATLNGEPLAVGDADDPATMALGGVYNIAGFDPIRFQRVRLLGCASLELAHVADGALDGFVDLRPYLRVVDVAASALFVEEAGGRLTDRDGEPLDVPLTVQGSSTVVAGGPAAHDAIMEAVA